MNLTPWSNLFSTASKSNICVKKSRYKVALTAGATLLLFLFILVFFTYAYHLALVISVVAFVLLAGMLSKKPSNEVLCVFELNDQGLCSFSDNAQYQLQESSRFSFLGCWLVLQPLTSEITVNSNMKNKKHSNKTMLFIYRDSLSKQDFSRLTNTISKLGFQY
jgi:hypothetical protein